MACCGARRLELFACQLHVHLLMYTAHCPCCCRPCVSGFLCVCLSLSVCLCLCGACLPWFWCQYISRLGLRGFELQGTLQ